MKRLLLIAGLLLAILGLLAGGLAWALRRQPAAAHLLDDQASPFTLEASGPGQWIKLQDGQAPLRAFHWVAPMPGGLLAAQMLGQNDRQRVALFRDGQPQDPLLVLKPVGVSDGFWRFATLQAAAQGPAGTLLLIYQPGLAGGSEAALALGLEVASQQVRWFCRGDFTRLALTPGGEAVYLYGGKGPIQRVALNQPAPKPSAIDLPPEIPQAEALLATGPASILVSHRNGLSSYRPRDGWSHFPGPEERGVPCRDFPSALVRCGKEIWWQAVPGRLSRVHADGSSAAEWRAQLSDPDAFARDAALLRLLGADPAGRLWFTLATPLPGAPTEAPPTEVPADAPAATGSPAPAPDWGSYAAAGLDRLYRLGAGRRSLERIALPGAWAALRPPPMIPAPPLGQGLTPEAGVLLAEGPRSAWVLPLEALPLVQAR